MNNSPARGSRMWIPIVLGIALGFLPILISFFRQQWLRPEYQAFPLVLGGAGYFLFQRLSVARPTRRFFKTINIASWIVTVVSFVVLAASFQVFSPWLAMVAFELFIFAVAITLWRDWECPDLPKIWFLLALLLPPPLDRDEMFIEWLQLFSSRMTSGVLDFVGILHVMQGNALNLVDRQLFVDEACSGIVSMISIIYCIALYCVWQSRSVVHMLLMIAVGIFATVIMNTVRLSLIGMAWSWFQLDLVSGVPHTLLSLVLFLATTGAMFGMDRFLLLLFSPIDADWRLGDQSDSNAGLGLMVFWDRFVAWRPDPGDQADLGSANRMGFRRSVGLPSILSLPVALGFGALGVAYLSFFGRGEAIRQVMLDAALDRALELNQEFDPCEGLELEFQKFSSERREIFRWDNWGQYSRTYAFADDDGNEYQISCDFMFGPHWHDLRQCYRGTGWKITNETTIFQQDLGEIPPQPVSVDSSLTAPWVIEQFQIERTESQLNGLITYGAFRADGQHVNRPRGNGLWADFWAHVVQGRDRAQQADYFQVQVTSYFDNAAPSDKQRRLMEQALKVAIERFSDAIVKK